MLLAASRSEAVNHPRLELTLLNAGAALLVAACGARTGIEGEREGRDGDGGLESGGGRVILSAWHDDVSALGAMSRPEWTVDWHSEWDEGGLLAAVPDAIVVIGATGGRLGILEESSLGARETISLPPLQDDDYSLCATSDLLFAVGGGRIWRIGLRGGSNGDGAVIVSDRAFRLGNCVAADRSVFVAASVFDGRGAGQRVTGHYVLEIDSFASGNLELASVVLADLGTAGAMPRGMRLAGDAILLATDAGVEELPWRGSGTRKVVATAEGLGGMPLDLVAFGDGSLVVQTDQSIVLVSRDRGVLKDLLLDSGPHFGLTRAGETAVVVVDSEWSRRRFVVLDVVDWIESYVSLPDDWYPFSVASLDTL